MLNITHSRSSCGNNNNNGIISLVSEPKKYESSTLSLTCSTPEIININNVLRLWHTKRDLPGGLRSLSLYNCGRIGSISL